MAGARRELRDFFCAAWPAGRLLGLAWRAAWPAGRLSASPGAPSCALGAALGRTWPSNLASELPNCPPQALPSGSKRLPSPSPGLPNLQKTKKNAVLSSNFRVLAFLLCKCSWTAALQLLCTTWVPPGPYLQALGRLLGPTWGQLGRSWGQLGRSWGHLGRTWGQLGRTWVPLGRTWG